MSAPSPHGAVIRAETFMFEPSSAGCDVATVVGPHLGAQHVMLQVVRLMSGSSYEPDAGECEQIGVVFSGYGKAHVADEVAPLEPAAAFYAPRGVDARIEAEQDMVIYTWRTTGAVNRNRAGSDPRRISSLWADETQLEGFAGTEGIDGGARPATMNFVFWPGTGSPRLCLHCGMQDPGEAFNVHTHPESDEAFFVYEGVGQVFLHQQWIDVSPGDVLFARPGVPHGTRNPDEGTQRFSTCGGPTPFDPMLYDRAGVSAEVV